MTELIISKRNRQLMYSRYPDITRYVYVDVDVDVDLVKKTINKYKLLSLELKEKFLYKNKSEITFFCKHAPWYLLENNMLFLHVARISNLNVFPRRMREYNRSIIICLIKS